MSNGRRAAGPAGVAPGRCPRCQAPVGAGERYCERCGSLVTTPPAAAGGGVPSTPGPDPRVEVDLGPAAAVSDRGRRRLRNEDSVTMVADGERVMAVVCDGVASTSEAHRASATAARVSGDVLVELIGRPGWPGGQRLAGTFSRAVAVAQSAVAGLAVDALADPDLSPATTLVAGVTAPGHLAVAGVGDSRAYWLVDEPERCRLLTVDDSLAEEQIAGGVTPERAYRHPDAHTITRWIGAGAEEFEVVVTSLEVTEGGLLVLCSDGLWNYFEAPGALGHQAAGASDRSALGIARHLMRTALRAGGHDNITVAVLPVRPEPPGADHRPTTSEEGDPP